ncbi:MAG TPA: hypothetical protein VEA69_07670 [Tepidisphaeraceae bacterium]|nr:hypothetical protein [Tepidisphaeraceae bacterium]
MMRHVARVIGVVVGIVGVVTVGAEPPARVEFTRIIAHWSDYGDDEYLKFVEDARPEVCQLGFYGGHFYSLAHTPQFKGYPAHFPVQGLAECGKWFENRNAAVHKLGAKVVGHFNVTFLVGEPGDPAKGEEARGFFKFYNELWDEKELGPRPVKDPMELLAKRADGSPMASQQYSIGKMREFTACLNNPHWRTVLKAWAKRAIERGVDGLIANYFYRHDCMCVYCKMRFKAYMGGRFTPAELKEKFGIDNLMNHKFTEIVGWHKPAESTPLRREMLRWSQSSCKSAFDDVFVTHAKSIKPDLIVAQWNHLSDFSQISGDERCMLPPERWGRAEDYLWYSTGAAANSTDLAEGYLGEGTLQARYVRGAFDDKPFTLGKYEQTRIRVAIAELAANGGAPMGFYTKFKDPAARAEIVRYYRFMEKYDGVYRANRPYAEALLLFPRSRVHAGDVGAVEAFKKVGRELLDRHVLFDVIPDDVWATRQAAPPDATPDESNRMPYVMVVDPTVAIPELAPNRLSRFEAPKTVRVSASRPAAGEEITLHLVNYDREEPAKKRSPGRGIADEKPVAAEGVKVDLMLPAGTKASGVKFATPEGEEVALKFEAAGGRVKFEVPTFLVYGVVRVTE